MIHAGDISKSNVTWRLKYSGGFVLNCGTWPKFLQEMKLEREIGVGRMRWNIERITLLSAFRQIDCQKAIFLCCLIHVYNRNIQVNRFTSFDKCLCSKKRKGGMKSILSFGVHSWLVRDFLSYLCQKVINGLSKW